MHHDLPHLLQLHKGKKHHNASHDAIEFDTRALDQSNSGIRSVKQLQLKYNDFFKKSLNTLLWFSYSIERNMHTAFYFMPLLFIFFPL